MQKGDTLTECGRGMDFCFFQELGESWTGPFPNTLDSVSLSGYWWGMENMPLPVLSILKCDTQSCQSGLFGEAGDQSL